MIHQCLNWQHITPRILKMIKLSSATSLQWWKNPSVILDNLISNHLISLLNHLDHPAQSWCPPVQNVTPSCQWCHVTSNSTQCRQASKLQNKNLHKTNRKNYPQLLLHWTSEFSKNKIKTKVCWSQIKFNWIKWARLSGLSFVRRQIFLRVCKEWILN